MKPCNNDQILLWITNHLKNKIKQVLDCCGFLKLVFFFVHVIPNEKKRLGLNVKCFSDATYKRQQ